MTARPIGTRGRGGGTRATISDGVPDDVVTNAVLQTELRALEQRLTIRLLATVGGGVGIVLAGLGVATAVILEAN